MSWDGVGAVAELVGAVGVILSMLFVAREIRGSAAVRRRDGTHNVADMTKSFTLALATDEALCALWRRGLAAPESLDPTERTRFRFLLLFLTITWEEVLHWGESDQIDPWLAHSLSATQRQVVGTPGFRDFWGERKDFATPELRLHLQPLIASGAASDRGPRAVAPGSAADAPDLPEARR